MGIIIDGFSHILPKSFAEGLNRAYPTQELGDLASFEYFGDTENRVRVLDKYKVDKQVLTIARPSIWMNMPSQVVPDMTRLANDTVFQAAQQFPDRFIPIGSLPVPSEPFMTEFDRCIGELGMPGIQVFSNIDGRPLDDPEFRPFFEKAHQTRTPIWIHPQVRAEWSIEFALDKLVGWLYDTTMALCRLVFSGLMDEYPDLTIITHHLGGMIPHFSERFRSMYYGRHIFPRANFADLSHDPLDYFKKFYGDTVLNGSVHAFECGYQFFDPDHIIFGTDYPFGPDNGEYFMEKTFDQINGANLPQTDKDKILGENLERLLEK
ncbi:MAG: amidohydrolase family protein [Deltaproteobacteria bacterium]|nr:amidohydrolase family protein [Deltaproteobacteria bacterium]